MSEFIQTWIHLDPMTAIRAGGYLGIALIVFAESGILLGMFLPGDSLLFAAGFLAAAGFLSPVTLVLTVVIAAIAGDSVGYWFGARVGPRLFTREDSRFFKKEYVTRTEQFYERYGGQAIIFARFVPIVRTLAPVLAGVGSMQYRTFVAYNVVGGILWGAGIVLLGYFLGALIPDAEQYLLPFTLAIIALSLLPVLMHYIRGK